MKPVFITGIGTGIGKTIVAAIITEAFQVIILLYRLVLTMAPML